MPSRCRHRSPRGRYRGTGRSGRRAASPRHRSAPLIRTASVMARSAGARRRPQPRPSSSIRSSRRHPGRPHRTRMACQVAPGRRRPRFAPWHCRRRQQAERLAAPGPCVPGCLGCCRGQLGRGWRVTVAVRLLLLRVQCRQQVGVFLGLRLHLGALLAHCVAHRLRLLQRIARRFLRLVGIAPEPRSTRRRPRCGVR